MASPATRIGFAEFVALSAAMMSTQALAVDTMLPALPDIVSELKVPNASHGQWVITAYLVGIALGQLFWGAFSDRFGRRPVLLCGLGLYILAAVLCGQARGFHELLFWRLLHGLAAASAVTPPNFGALAMEPLGAVAGVGASAQGFITTGGGALVGAAIGRHFNGSTAPLTAGALVCGLLCLLVVLWGERGHLFRGHPIDVSR